MAEGAVFARAGALPYCELQYYFMQKSCEFLALEIFYAPPRTFALGLELSYYRRFLSHFWPSKQLIELLLCPLKLPRLFLIF